MVVAQAAQRELELLGAGRPRRGDRRRRLARAARRGHARRRARALPAARRPSSSPREAPGRGRGAGARAGSSSTAIPDGSLVPRARGRALAPAGRPRGRRRHRAPDHRAARRAGGGGAERIEVIEGTSARGALERRRALPRRDHRRRARSARRRPILATGGAAALWARTTNPWGAIGAGPVMAHAAGAELADLELCQFHPTALAAPGLRGRRPAGHRGGPRRGRDAARRQRRALHRRARPARRGHARGPRPHGARRDRPRPARPARRSARQRFPNVFEALRAAGHDPAAEPGPGRPRLPLRDGRDRHRPRGPLVAAGPVRGRRVRLHRPARRQPARLQLPHRVLRARSAGGRAPPAAEADARAAPGAPAWRFEPAAGRDPRGGLAPGRPAAPAPISSSGCSRTPIRSPA